jgi:protein O-mannosyl-transferase
MSGRRTPGSHADVLSHRAPAGTARPHAKSEAPERARVWSQKRIQLILGTLLALLTFAAYARVLNHDFLYLDDRTYVTENAIVQKGLTLEGIKWAFTTVHGSNWHPLTWLSHMLDCSLFGLEPGGHHFTNLALHIINVILLFHLLGKMTGAVWPSAFVAGAFGLHPAHVESVAWVAERKDVLSTCLGLLAMIAFVRYAAAARRHPHPCPSPWEGEGSRGGSEKWYSFALVLFSLSLLAKPMMVTLPFVLLLLDYWPLGRTRRPTPLNPPLARGEARTGPASATGQARNELSSARGEARSDPRSMNGEPWWRLVGEKIPLLVMVAVSSGVTVYAQRAGGAMMTQAMLPIETRLSNAVVSYAKYLWMTIGPAGLAVYYPHPLKPHTAGLVAVAALVLLAITIGAVLLRRSRPYFLVGWLWFLGMLVPVIGLVQVGGQALADRYTYVPIVGLFIMAAWGMGIRQQGSEATRQEGTGGRRQKSYFGFGPFNGSPIVGAIGMTVLFVFGFCTWVQAGYWRDSVTLFQRAIDVVPENAQAHMFMANTLIRQGKVDQAVPHFAEAVRIVPNEPYNLTDYGHALLESGKFDEAASRLQEAIGLLPDSGDAHFFLGVAQFQQGRYQDAVKNLDRSLALNPRLLKAHLHLGSAYAAEGKWALAITHLQKWLQVEPRSVEALIKLAQCYASMGREPEALDTLQKAWNIDPKNPHPPALMAQIAALAGEIESAINLYNKALAIDPNYAEAANNLAQILSLHPDARFRDGKHAVQLAEIAAAARQFQDPLSLDTLAAAYAESGRFPEAMKTIDTAIELGRARSDLELVEHLTKRRALYASGKPARAE